MKFLTSRGVFTNESHEWNSEKRLLSHSWRDSPVIFTSHAREKMANYLTNYLIFIDVKVFLIRSKQIDENSCESMWIKHSFWLIWPIGPKTFLGNLINWPRTFSFYGQVDTYSLIIRLDLKLCNHQVGKNRRFSSAHLSFYFYFQIIETLFDIQISRSYLEGVAST